MINFLLSHSLFHVHYSVGTIPVDCHSWSTSWLSFLDKWLLNCPLEGHWSCFLCSSPWIRCRRSGCWTRHCQSCPRCRYCSCMSLRVWSCTVRRLLWTQWFRQKFDWHRNRAPGRKSIQKNLGYCTRGLSWSWFSLQIGDWGIRRRPTIWHSKFQKNQQSPYRGFAVLHGGKMKILC